MLPINPNVKGSLWMKEKWSKLVKKNGKWIQRKKKNYLVDPGKITKGSLWGKNIEQSTAFDNMWLSWLFGPFKAKNEPTMKAHPIVKQIANFWGFRTITGRNIVKAIKIKKTPEARKIPKYIRDFPEGTLLVAELKLPGISLTPFETLFRRKGKKESWNRLEHIGDTSRIIKYVLGQVMEKY